MVGYRGVDGSSVLDSPETVAALRSADDFLSQASLDGLRDSIARCAARLENEGVDLSGYNLPERIEDMEAARAALGYERINLLSESAGTRTAILYAQSHPESIHRSVMIAVNPPGHFVWKAEVIDEQLGYYSQLCAQDSVCSTRTDDLAQTMREVAHDMPERWLFMPIRPGNVRLGTFFGLFNTSTNPLSAPFVIDSWLSAAEGDASGLAMMSLFSKLVFPASLVWGDSAAIGMSDLAGWLEYLAEANLEDTILGTPGSTWVFNGAASWPAGDKARATFRLQPCDVETLLVGGTVDFSTPTRFARDELLPYLSRGQQVVLAEFGHTDDIWDLQSEATLHLLTGFYRTGEADDSRFIYQGVDFSVGLGYPEMAKLALAFVVIMPLLLVALVWFVVRRARRRR